LRAKKLTVAIDFDEVLFPLSVELIRRHNGQYGTSFTTNHFVTYVLGDVWGHTYVESVAKVHAFLGEDHINVPPIAGAVDALAQLRQKYELIVVTSRDRLLQQQTERWLSSHFPGPSATSSSRAISTRDAGFKRRLSFACSRMPSALSMTRSTTPASAPSPEYPGSCSGTIPGTRAPRSRRAYCALSAGPT